jgi:uncharacterized membrane protein YdjX (TVP38/TMEM64 family)
MANRSGNVNKAQAVHTKVPRYHALNTAAKFKSRDSESGPQDGFYSPLSVYRCRMKRGDEMKTGPIAMADRQNSLQWRRFIAPLCAAALLGAGYAFGLHNYFTLQSIAENRAALADYTADHLILTIVAFVAVYTAAVAVSFPGASILTILAGLLFGWALGGTAAIIAATMGATIVFQIAKSSFGDVLAKKAGPFLNRISAGFADDAFNYLLFLRLVPAFPFWLVNIAPALANVKLRTFVITTVLGIIPGTFAFAFVGAGLDSVITAQQASHVQCVAEKSVAECPFGLSVSSLVTTELLLAFAALGVVSVIPVVIKKWKTRHHV